MENKSLITIALEFIFKDMGGDEIPLTNIIDQINAIQVCSKVERSNIITVVNDLINSNLYESDQKVPINDSALIWKASNHPTLSKPANPDEIIHL